MVSIKYLFLKKMTGKYGGVLILLLLFSLSVNAQPIKFTVPEIDGIKVTAGNSVPILPDTKTALAFRFTDGRLVVGRGDQSMWSYDNGKTWKPGPPAPGEKVALDMGDGDIISIKRNSRRQSGDTFIAKIKRSTDNWKTVEDEEIKVNIPNVSHVRTGGGDMIDGFLFHHGLLKLPNGNLIATMYGNFEGDTELCDGYPPELGQRKYRTIVVFSRDKGHSWGDPVSGGL